MNRTILGKASVAVAAGVSLMFTSGVASGQSQSAERPYRTIVLFEEEVPVNEASKTALESRGGQVLGELDIVNGLVVLLPDRASASRIQSLDSVRLVEEDVTVSALHHRDWHDGGGGGEEEDSTQPAQTIDWGVDRIDAPAAWSSSTGTGVNVAIIDTGIQLDHSDLNVVRGVDCTKGPTCDKGGDGNDDNGHGTHVAGISSALNNDIGTVGVAPDADLHAVKVLKKDGTGFLSDVIEGIEWSVKNNMEVVNMSLGVSSSSEPQSLKDAVDAAYAEGLLLVASAGNNGDDDNEPVYPAAHDSVMAIGATDSDDNLAPFSNTSSGTELVAPGVDITSTFIGDSYDTFSGTSMASPHVAGTAALVWGADGTLTNDGVRQILTDTAEDLGLTSQEQGSGLVDAESATTTASQ